MVEVQFQYKYCSVCVCWLDELIECIYRWETSPLCPAQRISWSHSHRQRNNYQRVPAHRYLLGTVPRCPSVSFLLFYICQLPCICYTVDCFKKQKLFQLDLDPNGAQSNYGSGSALYCNRIRNTAQQALDQMHLVMRQRNTGSYQLN